MDKKKNSTTFRYLFMLCIYNLIMAVIVYSAQVVSETYHFKFAEWSWITYWIFISILIFIGGLFAYLTPFFVELLEEISNRIIVSFQVKYSKNTEKLEKKLRELKEDDND